ncbi:MAG: hypothetical protein WDW20_03335, partial [Neisseriaceae bacterium]
MPNQLKHTIIEDSKNCSREEQDLIHLQKKENDHQTKLLNILCNSPVKNGWEAYFLRPSYNRKSSKIFISFESLGDLVLWEPG